MFISCDQLETGDILLFSTNKWYSDVIEVGDECVYSHCGVILRDPVYLDPSLQGLYLFESGLEPFPDATDGLIHFGVQIVPLQKVIDEYMLWKEGAIYHRHLNCKRDSKFEDRIQQAYQTVKNMPYNCNPMDWIEALLGFHWFDKQITTRFWCSALVAYLYVKLELIDQNIDWTLVTPRDWWSGSPHPFIFLNGSSLEKEIRLI
jgi:hypothetical protein